MFMIRLQNYNRSFDVPNKNKSQALWNDYIWCLQDLFIYLTLKSRSYEHLLIIIFIYWSTITIVTLLLISVHTNNKENDEQVPWWFYMIIAILTPIIILCLIAYFFKLVYQYGWRLAWARIFHEESFDRWESIMRNKEERIDKELNGWPEDPMERAKCPRLQLWLDNQFECND